MEEIDLRQIFKIFYEKKIFIIITTILLLVLGYFYTKYYLTPRYQSSTTLVLSKADSGNTAQSSNFNDDQAINQTDINLNNGLINTYRELIKSKKVLKQVIENVGIASSDDSILSKEISALSKSVNVTSVQNTSIIQITVSNEDPALAANIANEIPNVFGDEIDRIYNIKNVYIIDTAEVTYDPYNISLMKNIAMFGAAGFILSLMIVMLLFYLDNTIKTSDDIENFIGLNTLSVVPQVKTIV